MKAIGRLCPLVLLVLLPLLVSQAPPSPSWEQAVAEKARGRFQEAAAFFEQIALQSPGQTIPLHQVVSAIPEYLDCLRRLDLIARADEFLEKVAERQRESAPVLAALARAYEQLPHYGYRVEGRFQRGPRRGGGEYLDVSARDRRRALQLYESARQQANRTPLDPAAMAQLLANYADALLAERDRPTTSWSLQTLTHLDSLPDWGEASPSEQATSGAPVGPDGLPITYATPPSFEESRNDGERIRFLLDQAARLDPSTTNARLLRWAQFTHNQFGVETLADWIRPFSFAPSDGEETTNRFSLHTLSEEETIARLAGGVRRFTLPDEHNPIRLLRRITDQTLTPGRSPAAVPQGESAWNLLAEIFENRRQFEKAAECWQRSIEQYGPGHDQWKQKRLDQIVGHWGTFESLPPQPQDGRTTIPFRFRNGRKVFFTAQPIAIARLLEDIRAILISNPRELDWRLVQIEPLGYTLIESNRQRYIQAPAVEWSLNLEPAPRHFDRRVLVTPPPLAAGAWWLTARMENGNTSHVVLWRQDAILVQKPLTNGVLLFFADAASGTPIANASIEAFGWQSRWIEGAGGRSARMQVETDRFPLQTNPQGLAFLTPSDRTSLADKQWLFTATSTDGRFAFLGFRSFWFSPRDPTTLSTTRSIVITDRPVYRPGQTIHIKAWISPVRYDLPETESPLAGASFTVHIRDPRGERIFETHRTADAWGGVEFTWTPPSNAPLGRYTIVVPDQPVAGTFRLEAYKKPEFEVLVEVPGEPVVLGETTTVRIVARTYFGAPVQEGTLSYRILRYAHTTRWFPPSPWDWLYGPGAGWISPLREAGPTAFRHVIARSGPFWRYPPSSPPEVVADNTVPLPPTGTIAIPLDTSPARDLFGNTDHRYEIVAEVRDASRRTIVGRGQVIASRKPFAVFLWTHRGFYRTGDPIVLRLTARQSDGQSVTGAVRVILQRLRVAPDDGLSWHPIQEWNTSFTEESQPTLTFPAAQPGQYRLVGTVTDHRGRTGEGTAEFTVRGVSTTDQPEFRFTAFALIPETPIVSPGENAGMLIQSQQPDATVLLFVRPEQGRYPNPEVVRLSGRTDYRTFPVIPADRPNIFVEALTVQGGRVHTDVREILVPPDERILDLSLSVERASVQPGETNRLRVRVTGPQGKPVRTALALTVYDRAVEYIAGGSNVPDIRTAFWKWKRNHWPDTLSSADRIESPVFPRQAPAMASIGLFGATVADDEATGLIPSSPPTAVRALRGGAGHADAVPMPLMAMAREETGSDRKAAAASPGEEEQTESETPIRSEFADTALWAGSLETDENGQADIVVSLPDNLGEWKVRAWAFGQGARVGEDSTSFVTDKPFLLRLQAPRFFVEKDEVVLSANILNRLPGDRAVRAVLELDGPTLSPLDETVRRLTIPMGKEVRVDWRVRALREGEAVIRMKALTTDASDAMEMRFPVLVHGLLRTESWSGVLRPPAERLSLTLTVPRDRRPDETVLTVRWSPTIAGALVDALPFLISYPHGCTEQTLNRFVPAVIVRRVLQRTGVDLAALKEARANLNPQELGDPAQRAQGWQREGRNPVFDEAELNEIIQTGIARLADMQNGDGGWNWFPGWRGESCPHLTAQIVHGLIRARDAGAPVPPTVLARGTDWLTRYAERQVERLRPPAPTQKPRTPTADNLDALALAVLTEAGRPNPALRDILLRDRADLSLYGLALLGLALDREGETVHRDDILQQVMPFVEQDEENQTAWLRLNNRDNWWFWYGDEMETHAAFLQLLTRTDPAHPVAPRLAKYLLNNRKHATAWRSTRDTAFCIEALADYLLASGEDRPDLTAEFRLDGRPLGPGPIRITTDNLFRHDNTLHVGPHALSDGEHLLEIIRTGRGPLYFNAWLTHFTQEDPIPESGLEVRIHRRLFRVTRPPATTPVPGSQGSVVDLTATRELREEIAESEVLRSGDLVEVELTLESKNDYEYLMVEDPKAAGFEAVDLRSGYQAAPLWPYIEYRDDRVCLFLRTLPRGQHTLRYRVRAEIPGRFGLLPARIAGMYAPELTGSSISRRVLIRD